MFQTTNQYFVESPKFEIGKKKSSNLSEDFCTEKTHSKQSLVNLRIHMFDDFTVSCGAKPMP